MLLCFLNTHVLRVPLHSTSESEIFIDRNFFIEHALVQKIWDQQFVFQSLEANSHFYVKWFLFEIQQVCLRSHRWKSGTIPLEKAGENKRLWSQTHKDSEQ